MHDIRFHRHHDSVPRPEGHRVIAVCGKGGVGKTAFSALLVNELARRPEAGAVLAIDADPALGLALALGVEAQATIGEVREEIIGAAQSGSVDEERRIAENLDQLVFDSVVEWGDFAFLAMGRSDAMGCYCSVNDILRDAIEMLAAKFDTIVIDGEAGLEQLNRQVLGHIDHLMLLSDGSRRSANTVALLRDIAVREGIAEDGAIELVFNRSTLGIDDLVALADELSLPVAAHLPFDDELVRLDAENLPLGTIGAGSETAHEVAHLVDHLLGVGHAHAHKE